MLNQSGGRALCPTARYLVEVLWSVRCLFLPRARLECAVRDILLSKFLAGNKEVVFFKSGRSALRAVFRGLSKVIPERIVLVPDYICNVVPRAAVEEGFQCVSYRTDEHCTVDCADLELKVRSQRVAAIVLASIFGAQNTAPGVVGKIRAFSPEVVIVLDECQNLVWDMDTRPDAGTIVVFSFNQKTIPGALGGGVAFGKDCLRLQAPGMQVRDLVLGVYVWLVLFNQVRARLQRAVRRWRGRPPYPPPRLEYTPDACGVHYDLEIQRIARLSLCRALDGLRRFQRSQRVRLENFRRLQDCLSRNESGRLQVVAAPENCPFIPIQLHRPGVTGWLPLKGAYALEGSPQTSARPSWLSVRNHPEETVQLASGPGAA